MENGLEIHLNGQINFNNLRLMSTYVNKEDWNTASEEDRKEFIKTALLEESYDMLERVIDDLMNAVKYELLDVRH